jgi:hypothetical protein
MSVKKDATPAPVSKPIGTKTLFGVGLAGMSFPVTGKSLDPARAAPGAGRPAGSSAPDFLSEVAKALNAQATDARARALEPGRNVANGTEAGQSSARQSGPRQEPAETAKISSWVESAEFEEPDDEPTSLTPGIISLSGDLPEIPVYLHAPDDRRESRETSDPKKEPWIEQVSGTPAAAALRIDHEEPVVLGPPSRASAFQASETWPKDEVTPAESVSSQSAEGQRPNVAGGLSLSGPGYSRPGTPPSLPSLPSLPSPSLRSGGGNHRTASSDLQAVTTGGAFGDVAPAETNQDATYAHTGNLRSSAEFSPLPVVAARPESYSRKSTGEVHLLRSYIKLAIPTLAGLIGATFVGGLVVGVLVGRGRSDTSSFAAPAAKERAAAPSSVTIVATPAGTVLTPTVVGSGAPSVAAATAGGAAAHLPSGSAPGEVEKGRPLPPPSTATATASAPLSPTLAAHSADSRDARIAPLVAPLPRAKAPESLAQSPPSRSKAHSPSNAGTTTRSGSSRRAAAAVRSTAGTPRPAAPGSAKSAGGTKPAARGAQGKPGWRDPFAE